MKKCCEKKKAASTPGLDFKEQTPEMQIGEVNVDPLYEKAFLSREEKQTTEYAKNTTTWD